MPLVDRLAGIGDPETSRKLPVLTFHACMYEMAAGKITRQQFINHFDLDAGEVTELDWIIGRYNAQPTAAAKEKFVELMRVVFILAEAQVAGYTTNAEIAARIDAI